MRSNSWAPLTSTLERSVKVVLIAVMLLWLQAATAQGVAQQSEKQAERSGATLAASDCGGRAHLEEVQCLARYLQWLDGELNRAYQIALAKTPVKGVTDDRKSREQLRRSQRAWLKYKDENCALIGGLEGGSSLWVTHYAGLCEEREVKDRIKFLRSISE